jgi:hypothetical protein
MELVMAVRPLRDTWLMILGGEGLEPPTCWV